MLHSESPEKLERMRYKQRAKRHMKSGKWELMRGHKVTAGFHREHFNRNTFQLLTVQFGLEPVKVQQKNTEQQSTLPVRELSVKVTLSVALCFINTEKSTTKKKTLTRELEVFVLNRL